jgi:hypothetical protein
MAAFEGGQQFSFLLRAAAEGISANQALSALSEAGIGIRRQVGLRLYAEARRVTAESGEEPSRPLDQVPALAEAPPTPTRTRQGVLQTVTIFVRENVTGNIRALFHNTVSDTGVTRQEAINEAVDAYNDHAAEYPTVIVGAVHTSARTLVPQAWGAAS